MTDLKIENNEEIGHYGQTNYYEPGIFSDLSEICQTKNIYMVSV
jgi:hypothetical protein